MIFPSNILFLSLFHGTFFPSAKSREGLKLNLKWPVDDAAARVEKGFHSHTIIEFIFEENVKCATCHTQINSNCGHHRHHQGFMMPRRLFIFFAGGSL